MLSPVNPVTPKDAAAVILLRRNTDSSNPEIFWVKRNPQLAFLGGFYAFPGGQIDESDTSVDVRNAADEVTATMITGAARELFEELGVLVVHGGDTLTKGQRESLRDDLESKRMPWPALLRHYDLHLNAHDFTFVGRWVTPPFSPRRFDTWFFLVTCPARQEPRVVPGELSDGEWIAAKDAYERWFAANELVAPPTLHALKTLAEGLTADLLERFLSVPQAHGQTVRAIEFRPNYVCFPVRTPTRPPATHTNCYVIYTSKEFFVVDPGSPYEDEQIALTEFVDELQHDGRRLTAILLTHLHPDHVGGVNSLLSHVGPEVHVAAHGDTAAALSTVNVNQLIEDDEILVLDGEPPIQLRAMHTPGHARGHLCFHDDCRGILLTGDNIVGLGSVLIDPPEGNMRDYFESLRRMRAVKDLKVLLGGHGPPMLNAYGKIDEYINHRREREQNILNAVASGCDTIRQIVNTVYTDVSPKAHPLAERAVLAHLQKLEADGVVRRIDDDRFEAALGNY
ncbi:MAG TPA: MBL fold metallo-hydrolase [Pyrinomonadaceae bacterium]|jgi:glyoxylase-like metal-dependent hydrolase (beta-lactamase superfamily II)/8-oxo-dGTP pyrophosphatase MutT (NUDIX family)